MTQPNPTCIFAILFSSNGSKDSTLSSNAYVYKEFVTIAINNKASYTVATVVKEKKLILNYAWETTKLLRHENVILQKFRLDILQAPLLLPETANTIGFWYSRLHLWAKT